MRSALVVLGLLSVSMPAVAAPIEGCHANLVCASEWDYTTGDCDDGFIYRQTRINLANVALITGTQYCSGSGGYGTGEQGVHASVLGGVAAAGWNEFYYNDPENGEYRGCFIFVSTVAYVTPPCPIAPPNPGWGDALP